MKREVRLYNLILPVWLIWLFPQLLIFVAPANLLVDGLVLILTLMALKHQEKRAVVKALWGKFWIRGFLADFIGVLLLLPGGFLSSFLPNVSWASDVGSAICTTPFSTLSPFCGCWRGWRCPACASTSLTGGL